MRRGFKVAIWSIATFFLLASGLLASIAWFESGRNEIGLNVNGSVVEEYFHCGTGAENDPFVITRPIHYYHLVEFFQRETELPIDNDNTADFGVDYLYFQVGYDLDNDGDLDVYDYDDQGIYQGTEERQSLSTTLNMAYYSGENALLPIGTNQVPFIGSFNGGKTSSGGITIANLSIHCSEDVVIGNSTITRSASDIGVFGYVADSVNAQQTVIHDAFFDNLTIDLTDIASTAASSSTGVSHIDTHDDNEAYVGYIAGHVHSYTNKTSSSDASPLHNVYVNNATIQGGPGATCGYGYIGRVDTNDGEGMGSIENEVSELHGGGEGEGDAWGGSINMVNLYNNLSSIENSSATYVDTHQLVQTKYSDGSYSAATNETFQTDAFKNYRNGDDSYCFANKYTGGGDNEIIFLAGSKDKRKVLTDQSISEKTFYISNEANESIFYLPNWSNARLLLGSITVSGSLPADAKWFYDGNTPSGANGTTDLGHIWCEHEGQKYYLAVTSEMISSYYRLYVSTSVQSYTWSMEGVNRSGTTFGEPRIDGYLTTTHLGTKYNFYALNSARTNGQTPLMWFFKTSYATTIIENSGEKDDMYDTCFRHSTGYVASGLDYSGNSYPTGSGDIRVAKYDSSNITDASTVLTVNSSGTSVVASSALFDTYTETNAKFRTMLEEDSSHYYGLHFMNAQIGSQDITVPSSGRKIPSNCVQFSAARPGSIKFFAGTYFGVGSTEQNDAFFSLYKINRSGNNYSLEEIKYIYKKAGESYIYSASSIPPEGYTLAFDSTWIANPGSLEIKRLYYFEIPVNPGEFALGSTPGHNGAYLMYLDIGASGGIETPSHDDDLFVREEPLFTQIGFSTGSYFTNSCFNIAYVVPVGSEKTTFSIKVTTRTEVSYNDGTYTCYDLIIINTSGAALTLDVLLLDNDDDPDNEYLYMYSITYNNGSRAFYTYSDSFTGISGGASMTPTSSQGGGS